METLGFVKGFVGFVSSNDRVDHVKSESGQSMKENNDAYSLIVNLEEGGA